MAYLKTLEDRHYVSPAPRKLQWESHSNNDLENPEVAHESANVYLASEEKKKWQIIIIKSLYLFPLNHFPHKKV